MDNRINSDLLRKYVVSALPTFYLHLQGIKSGFSACGAKGVPAPTYALCAGEMSVRVLTHALCADAKGVHALAHAHCAREMGVPALTHAHCSGEMSVPAPTHAHCASDPEGLVARIAQTILWGALVV